MNPVRKESLNLTKVMFGLVLGFCLIGPVSDLKAEIMVDVRNDTGSRAFISFAYHDAVSNGPITRGWWEVNAFSNRSIRVNTERSSLMWFAYNESGQAWGGDGGQGESRHVVKEQFFVKDGWKPRGKKHMLVVFKKANASGGNIRIRLSLSNSNTTVNPG